MANAVTAALRSGRRGGLAQTVASAADLLEEGDRAHAGVASDARDLLLTEVEPDPGQPRKRFDDSDLRALADDIALRGVLQPILVRPPREPGGPYRIVAGERRWRASRLAGRVRIPARVRDIPDGEVRPAQLAENVLREDLSDIEKGQALRGLYEWRKAHDPRTTWEAIATEVGLGKARIHDLYQLATLPAGVAALIEADRLSGSHGILLHRAMERLSEERVGELAAAAARPEGRRAGAYGMSVAVLRSKILSETAEAAGVEPAAAEDATAPMRPFVRRTLEALSKGKLSGVERELLLAALRGPDGGTGG